MAALRQVLGELRQVVGHRAREEGDLALDDARRVRPARRRSPARASKSLEGDQRLQPRLRRRQRHLDFQHQAVGAPEVVHAQRLGAAQLDDLRLGLDASSRAMPSTLPGAPSGP